MTKQEYYDLLCCCAQDGEFPAIDETGSCKYLTSDKHKCAVGLLFDGNEGASFNCCGSVECLPYEVVIRLLGKLNNEVSLLDLGGIQGCHDSSFSGRSRLGPWAGDLFIQSLNKLFCFSTLENKLAGQLKPA